jgi:hypothetical protein
MTEPDPRFLAELTRAIVEGDLNAAQQIADYMSEEAIPGNERAAVMVAAARRRAGQRPA